MDVKFGDEEECATLVEDARVPDESDSDDDTNGREECHAHSRQK